MENDRNEFEAFIASINERGELEYLKKWIQSKQAIATFERHSEDVFENTNKLLHWNGMDWLCNDMLKDIEDVVNPN
jgi:hypothetical protein